MVVKNRNDRQSSLEDGGLGNSPENQSFEQTEPVLAEDFAKKLLQRMDKVEAEVVKQRELGKTEREKSRRLLALLLTSCLGFTILLSAVFTAALISSNNDSQDEQNIGKDIITLLVTSQTGLLGAALGFYFGGRSESDEHTEQRLRNRPE